MWTFCPLLGGGAAETSYHEVMTGEASERRPLEIFHPALQKRDRLGAKAFPIEGHRS